MPDLVLKTNMEDVKKNEYEIGFMVKNAEALADLENVLSGEQAEVITKSQPREVRLAYPIEKHTNAFFGFSVFRVLPEAVSRIKKALHLKENILRFIVVKPVAKKVSKAAPKEEKPVEGPVAEVQLPRVLTNEALEEKLEEILK